MCWLVLLPSNKHGCNPGHVFDVYQWSIIELSYGACAMCIFCNTAMTLASVSRTRVRG